MVNMSVQQFATLVELMRNEQKKFEKQHSYFTSLSENSEKSRLEKQVDKALSDRKKRLLSDEDAVQGTLF